MSIEQMNISLSPQMARFIRNKVRKGEYTNISEVVRDAVRRMQEEETRRKERAALSDSEARLTKEEREGIRRGIRRGIKDIEEGHYEEYDADGLRALAKKLLQPPRRNDTAIARRDKCRAISLPVQPSAICKRFPIIGLKEPALTLR